MCVEVGDGGVDEIGNGKGFGDVDDASLENVRFARELLLGVEAKSKRRCFEEHCGVEGSAEWPSPGVELVFTLTLGSGVCLYVGFKRFISSSIFGHLLTANLRPPSPDGRVRNNSTASAQIWRFVSTE